MALEFALRPRISLERPASRRRLRAKLPPLALPMAVYWTAMAGGTYLLVQNLREEPSADTAEAPPLAEAPALEDAPASDEDLSPPNTSAPETARATAFAPAASSFEPAALPAGLENAPFARATTPAPTEAAPAAPESPRPEPEPAASASNERTPEPAFHAAATLTRKAPASQPGPAPASARPEPRAFGGFDPFALVEDPRPRDRELPKLAVREEREPGRAAAADAPGGDAAPAVSLPSCESAAARNEQTIDLRSAGGAPDLPREAFASVLENGAYLTRCAVPARTTLEICAAVRDGKVVGVSATSRPSSSALNACVRRAVSTLRFPQSARLDITRTRFEPSR